MNKLILIHRNDVEDYFRRLGGSGCYDGYRDWNSPVLILCLLMNLDIDSNINPLMSKQTDNLPTKVKNKLDSLSLDKTTLLEFIEYVRDYLKKLHPNDLYRFDDFLYCNKEVFDNYVDSLN